MENTTRAVIKSYWGFLEINQYTPHEYAIEKIEVQQGCLVNLTKDQRSSTNVNWYWSF